MQTTYRVLFPGPQVLHGAVDWPVIPARENVGALVRPYLNDEPYELVTVYVEGVIIDMAIAEMGHVRLTTRAPLPINVAATELYRDSYARLYPDEPRSSMPAIAGAAIVFDRLLRA